MRPTHWISTPPRARRWPMTLATHHFASLVLALLPLTADGAHFAMPPTAAPRPLFQGHPHTSSAISQMKARRCNSASTVRSGRGAIMRAEDSSSNTALLWFTGVSDLRLNDHPGLLKAAAHARIAPVFILDDAHCRCKPPAVLRQLHQALVDLDKNLQHDYGLPLIFRRGRASDLLPEIAIACGATVCYLPEDDVDGSMRAMQRAAGARLCEGGVELERWSQSLRPTAPWSPQSDGRLGTLPLSFDEYVAIARSLPVTLPLGKPGALSAASGVDPTAVPTPDQLLCWAAEATPSNVREARARFDTSEPYADFVTSWCGETEAARAVDEYCDEGREAFARLRLRRTHKGSTRSLHCAAADWLAADGSVAEVLGPREAATRAFTPPLVLGSLSARELRRRAAAASPKKLTLGSMPPLGVSSAAALADVIEWREWSTLLACDNLDVAEAASDDLHEEQEGKLGYWRWNGQYLTKYLFWRGTSTEGEGVSGGERPPALLCVHGFAASSRQWRRLVKSLRAQHAAAGTPMPDVYALDLVGFGRSETPALSYTQHLWEAQIVDFVMEVMEGRPVVLAGNSIGGGLSAGAASNLGPICRGLVLCNTAGVLVKPEEYIEPQAETETVGGRLLAGTLPPHAPLPIGGPHLLDLFGIGVITLLRPRIPSLLRSYYPTNPENADFDQAREIARDATDPGSPTVIASGQKLPAQRPLNEVLSERWGFAGPVLVPQGELDPLSGAGRAQERAEALRVLRPHVSVIRLPAGHCPHDEAPDEVAAAICDWLPSTQASVESLAAQRA